MGSTFPVKYAEHRERTALRIATFGLDTPILPFAEKERLSVFRRSRVFTDAQNCWMNSRFQTPRVVGSVMTHLKETAPLTKAQFIRSYFAEVRSYAQFLEIAAELSVEFALPMNAAFNVLFIHVIDESWNGYATELSALQLVQKHLVETGVFEKVRFSSPGEDINGGVDLVLECDATPKYGIQVKPDSYWVSTRPEVEKAREKNRSRNKRFVESTGASVRYMRRSHIEAGVFRLLPAP